MSGSLPEKFATAQALMRTIFPIISLSLCTDIAHATPQVIEIVIF